LDVEEWVVQNIESVMAIRGRVVVNMTESGEKRKERG